MSYPTYRQDFEGGSTLAAACPELVDLTSGFSISTSGHALTGTHSLSCSTAPGGNYIYSIGNDTLSGNVTLTAYTQSGSNNGFAQILTRIRPAGQLSADTWLRMLLNSSGMVIVQNNAGTGTALNTPISGVTIPTGVWLCLELRCNGTTISARIVRQDTGQFFVNSGNGSWSSSPQVQSGTTTVTGAGGYGFRGGDGISLYIDDLIYEPAIPSVDLPSFSLTSAGATQQLTAGGFTDPLNGVTWSSSNTGVATVNSAGLVTAVAVGTTTITATGKRDTAQTATSAATITTSSATGYSFTGPTPGNGFANNPSGNYTVTPNGVYTGNVTINPTSGFGLSTVVLTWSNSSISQTFTITPNTDGVVVLTPTNSGALSNQPTLSYISNPQSLSAFPGGIPSGSVTTLTLSGGGTFWLTQPPTFTSTGFPGFTLGTPSVTGNTSATITATAPSTTGTAVIHDSTTSGTSTVTVALTYLFKTVANGLNAGQAAGYAVYAGASQTPLFSRTTQGVVDIGDGSYMADASLPINIPVAIKWDDTLSHTAVENVNPTLAVANTLNANIGKLIGTGVITGVTSPGHFSISFDQAYSGNTASLTDGTLYFSFTSGLNQWHSRLITGGALVNPVAANLLFVQPFGQQVFVGDTFAIISD